MSSLVILFLCCVLYNTAAGQGVSPSEPVDHPAQFISSSQCGQLSDPLRDEQLKGTLEMVQQQLTISSFASCRDALNLNPSATSGYYMIQAANGSSVQVYCDMEGTNCGGEGGWTRVAYLNTTDPSTQCPPDFRIETANNKRFCIRDTNGAVCRGVEYEALGLSYTRVCGRVLGYGYGSPNAFDTTIATLRNTNTPVGDNYVDGVSITHGTTPTHIWTYAAGYREDGGSTATWNCPCNSNINNIFVPSYVGNDYYCEAGPNTNSVWRTGDPLWDGEQCGGTEGPCCSNTGLPWFNKNISPATTDSINVRVCADQVATNDNIGIELVELFVQ